VNVGNVLRSQAIAFHDLDSSLDRILCKQERPIVIYYGESEQKQAEAAAAAVQNTLVKLGYKSDPVQAIFQRQEPHTRTYFSVCMTGIR
jgi:hypothetical protein